MSGAKKLTDAKVFERLAAGKAVAALDGTTFFCVDGRLALQSRSKGYIDWNYHAFGAAWDAGEVAFTACRNPAKWVYAHLRGQ